MKLTNDLIYTGIQILQNVSEKGKLGYACARNLRKLRDAGKEFLEKRDELVMKYGTLNEDGTLYMLPKEKVKDFNDELSEYMNIEHEVDIMQVDEETFCSGTLDNKVMYDLYWMVKEQNDEEL